MNTELISVFQDYKTDISEHAAHFDGIGKIRKLIGPKYIDLQYGGTFRAVQYVGFVSVGNTRLQVLPKIYFCRPDVLSEEAERKESLKFLYRMLEYTGEFPAKHLDEQSIGAEDYDLFEVFAKLFIDKFLHLFQRNVNHAYVDRTENQQIIRGKILFAENIRHNAFRPHLHFVGFEEFSIDNPLNQFFRRLMEKLIVKVRVPSTKAKFRIALSYLEDVASVPFSEALLRSIKFDRRNEVYKPLFVLGKMFFHNQQPGLHSGECQTFSFMVRVNDLFEQFVGKVLVGFSQDKVQIQYHAPQLRLYWKGEQAMGLLKPDFTVSVDGKVVCVLDTKYKCPIGNDGTSSISSSDIYQLVTYAVRYACHRLCLIYPRFIGSPKAEGLLAEYRIPTANEDILLRIVQVDITETDLERLGREVFDGCRLGEWISEGQTGQFPIIAAH